MRRSARAAIRADRCVRMQQSRSNEGNAKTRSEIRDPKAEKGSPKAEIRRPKEGRDPKPETRRPKDIRAPKSEFGFRISGFGLLSGFGSRPSDLSTRVRMINFTVTIDGQSVTVASGQSVLDAARSLAIDI